MIILALGYLIPLYLIFNLLKKVESLTDQLENLNQEAQDIYEVINKTYTEMKSIDAKGGFQADDEVGSIFKGLKEVIFNLRSLYGSTND
tara:strand:+ start:7572 stop:7838 length:267 start_codon:yes stop_codon:yes gene_type:complete